MYSVLLDFILNIPVVVGQVANWLTTPLEYLNMSPLALFSITGLTAIVGIHLIRLFVGG